MPDGAYRVLAVLDLTGNGEVDPGEPVGRYGQPNAVFVRGGAPVGGVVIHLQSPFAEVRLSNAWASPRQAAPSGSVNLRVSSDGADTVFAQVRPADAEAGTGTRVDLFDDGLHDDGAAGDGVYGGSFAVPTAATGDFTSISATDLAPATCWWISPPPATGVQPERGGPGEPLREVARLKIDAAGNGQSASPWERPSTALLRRAHLHTAPGPERALFDLWRTQCRGPVPDAVMGAFAAPDHAVVPRLSLCPRGYARRGSGHTLSHFLDAGGRLFLTGQDLAQAAEGSYFDRFDVMLRQYTRGLLPRTLSSWRAWRRSADGSAAFPH